MDNKGFKFSHKLMREVLHLCNEVSFAQLCSFRQLRSEQTEYYKKGMLLDLQTLQNLIFLSGFAQFAKT
jgi:hypothetical protein